MSLCFPKGSRLRRFYQRSVGTNRSNFLCPPTRTGGAHRSAEYLTKIFSGLGDRCEIVEHLLRPLRTIISTSNELDDLLVPPRYSPKSHPQIMLASAAIGIG